MRERIVRLPDEVANQIAAGEVVERPASVVKELLENAIDADARRLRVEVEGGGQARIQVIDDGHGMPPADAELCLERHATSKIREAADLTTVKTMGFRGEAVPSIASVSRFTLVTRERGASEGTEVVVEGGRTKSVRAVGAAEGTSIEVRDLFFNVPARQKFLKRPTTEMSHISDAVVRLALANRGLAFTLINEGRTLLDVPPESPTDPKGRLRRILGANVGDHLYEIPDDGGDWAVKVRGFVSSPELTERTARGLYIFVNGRFIRDRTIQHAIADAYRTLMERGRHPVVVLYVDVDPTTFDVNVHPQKTEVRFERSGDIHRAVSGTLRRALTAQPWLDQAERASTPYHLSTTGDGGLDGSGVARDGAAEHAARFTRAFRGPAAKPVSGGTTPRYRGPSSAGVSSGKDLGRYVPDVRPPSLLDQHPVLEADSRVVRFGALEPVGQVLGTYLVCQGPDRMIIVDQHAAHERIAFERMRKERKKQRVVVQPLLVPLPLELDPARAAIAESESERLAELGVELDHFGDGTWVVKSCPVALGAVKLEQLVLDLLDELKAVDQTTPFEERIDALLSCAACHTVVRAGDRLTHDEIKSLLVQMDEIDFGAHCPHGRPVFVEYDERTLGKMFHRT